MSNNSRTTPFDLAVIEALPEEKIGPADESFFCALDARGEGRQGLRAHFGRRC
jgi:hypothetical protein